MNRQTITNGNAIKTLQTIAGIASQRNSPYANADGLPLKIWDEIKLYKFSNIIKPPKI